MNAGNVVGGHKANLNNPSTFKSLFYVRQYTDHNADTSEESKQHSKEVLDQQYNGGEIEKDSGEKNPQNVAGGLKAYVLASAHSRESCLTAIKYYQEPKRVSGG